MFSAKDESSFRGYTFYLQVCGSSLLSLLAALIDLFSADGVSSKLETLFVIFNPSNFSLIVFGAKNSPVRLLVRDCQCLLPTRKSNSILPVFLIINQSKSARPGSPVTSRYLYNEMNLSRFRFCLNLSVNVTSVVPGSVNVISSTLLVSGVL